MEEKELNAIVAENIRKYMQRKGITQMQLREMIGVSQASISSWVTGVKLPRSNKLDALCEIFGCSRSDLLNENGKPSYFMPTPAEYELIQLFKGLSVDGQEEILKYARLIAASPLYKKCDNIQEREA